MPEVCVEDRVLALDLDGTVLGCNTFPHFVRFLLYGYLRRARVIDLIRLAGMIALRKTKLVSHNQFKLYVCRAGGRMEPNRVLEWARVLLETHQHSQVTELAEMWPGSVLLTTAAPECYAVAFGDLLSVDRVHASGERDGAFWNNEGERKVDRCLEAGDEVFHFVTDDRVVDAPMIAFASHSSWVDEVGRLRLIHSG